MRLEKKIDLGDGRSVTVKELRIKDIRKIVIEGAALYDVGFLEMLTDGFDNVLHLFSDCIDLTSQEIEDLSCSEVQAIYEAFKELNAFFFDQIEFVGGAADFKPAISTGPASSSSDTATGTSSTTDGASSQQPAKS